MKEKAQSNVYDHMFRYIIVGDTAVGKSCILLQFTDHSFKHQHELTIGVAFGGKNITIKDKTINIQIWDTAGQEAFQSITRSYYKGAIGALLVYDITSRLSFEHINKWLDEIKANSSKDICCILIGNKKDLEEQRQVTYEEGKNLAEKNNLLFLETSAKTAENIQESFMISAEKILEQIETTGIDPSAPTKNVKISIDEEGEEKPKDKKKSCCA
jgi:small GTP-binding protein